MRNENLGIRIEKYFGKNKKKEKRLQLLITKNDFKIKQIKHK